MQAERLHQLLAERLRDVALVREELPEQLLDQVGDRLAVIDIAGEEGHSQQLAPVVEHQVQFEAVEPPHRGLAALGHLREHLVLGDAAIFAHRQGGRIDEGDAAASAEAVP